MNETLYARTEQLKRVIDKNQIDSLRVRISRVDDSNPLKKPLEDWLNRLEKKYHDRYEEAYHLFGSDWQKEIYE